MLGDPVLRPNLGVEIIPEEGCCLIDENGVRVYLDRRFEFVLPLLNEINSLDDIVDHLQGTMPAAEVYFTLMQLEDNGFLVERGAFEPRTVVNECALLSANPTCFRSKVCNVIVVVDNLTTYTSLGRRFVSALADAGLRAGTDSGTADESDRALRVALVDDYLNPRLQHYHDARRDDGSDWLLVKPVGITAWVGPIFLQTSKACWECLAQRLRTNRTAASYLNRRLQRPVLTTSKLLSCIEDAAKSLLVGVIANDYAQQQSINEASIIEYDFRLGAIKRHPVVPLDTCTKCYPPRTATVRTEVILQSRPKLYTSDGGYRSVQPDDTLTHESRLVSSHTGIVSSFFRLDGSDPHLPVYLARHNYGYSPSSLSTEGTNLANTSAGKGRTSAQARASALCEAVERHSAFLQGYEPMLAGSLDAMGDEAIHPNDCMLYSQHQYSVRKEWNRVSAWVLRIPDPLEADEVIDWSPVWSLTHSTQKYLPTAYLYHSPHADNPPRGRRYCFSDSNGNACGNNIEEAILQGFLELVERDAVAIWWYNQLHMPVVELEALDDPYFTALTSAYRDRGRRVWVLDISHDLNVPVYVALSRNVTGPIDEILTGFGAHLDPRIAISRALTELNQMLPRSLRARDGSRRLDEETETWFKEVSMETAPFLAGRTGPPVMIRPTCGPTTGDLVDDIAYCRRLVENLGMEFLVHDQTRAETALSSVKVIVPGLRHYWRRLAMGRLYDIPVDLGWLDAPIQEHKLNPWSLLG